MNKEIDSPHPELDVLAEGLMNTFIHRRDLYPIQTTDGRYICIKKPLDTNHLVAHIKGDITLGAYVLGSDNYARYIVFDADDDNQFVSLFEMANFLATQGATSYLENSRRGGHLWMFFSRPTLGKVARKFASNLTTIFNLEGIEIFPKQNRLTGGPGSLIRLPLGIHRRTGQRYGFITIEKQPLASTIREQIRILSHPKCLPMTVFKQYYAFRSNGPLNDEKTENEPLDAVTNYLSTQIKDRISVVEFVSRYVELSPNGRGLCPFHDDHRYSFSVNVEKNYWYCFAGCGGGSIIDFWMKYKHCDFRIATKEMAEMLLIPDN